MKRAVGLARWSAVNNTSEVVEGPQTIVISRADLNPTRTGSLLERLADAVVTIETETGFGTAFLISEEGLALTNHHVIEGNGEIVAFLRDGRRAVGSLLRSDQRVDAALIRIDCRSLCTTAPLGDSGNVYVGDEVYAIGTPSLLSHTVTKGIVSAFRDTDGLTYIQTDAAVSPGSSGGPLVDAAGGKAVGIVTLKSTGLLDEGLGFAISIEDALRILRIEYFSAMEE